MTNNTTNKSDENLDNLRKELYEMHRQFDSINMEKNLIEKDSKSLNISSLIDNESKITINKQTNNTTDKPLVTPPKIEPIELIKKNTIKTNIASKIEEIRTKNDPKIDLKTSNTEELEKNITKNESNLIDFNKVKVEDTIKENIETLESDFDKIKNKLEKIKTEIRIKEEKLKALDNSTETIVKPKIKNKENLETVIPLKEKLNNNNNNIVSKPITPKVNIEQVQNVVPKTEIINNRSNILTIIILFLIIIALIVTYFLFFFK